MSITNILVHVGRDGRGPNKIRSVVGIAKQHGASVTGLYVVEPPRLPRYVEGYVSDETMGQAAEAEKKRSEALAADFHAQCETSEIDGTWVQKGGRDIEAIAELYRYTDLIVMGQSSPDDPDHRELGDLPEDVVMAAGRPVLILPFIGDAASIGKRVMIAWNRSREATRAVTDSIPILKVADEVVVYSVNPPGLDHLPGSYICDHLKRHGIDAKPRNTVANDVDVANTLLSRAHDLNIDLIVMGAYGHSRLREHILGGATRDLFLHMTRPVLMSH